MLVTEVLSFHPTFFAAPGPDAMLAPALGAGICVARLVVQVRTALAIYGAGAELWCCHKRTSFYLDIHCMHKLHTCSLFDKTNDS